MGQSIGRARLLQETQIFATWTINDVKELEKRFRTQVFGFSLVEAQFESIISFKENMTKNFSFEILFDTLDNDNDGRIDGLELLAGLTLCCHGEFEDKAKFCFELFDFNLNATLSKKEMVVMMMACICGLNILTGGGEEDEPELEVFEKLAANAFLRADKDKSGSISCEEFTAWARSNRDMMATIESLTQVSAAAKLDLDSEDSAEAVSEADLSDFDLGSPPSYVSFEHPIKFDDETDNFHAILKWKEIENEPTNFVPSRLWNDGPESNLSLSWVHGVRGKDGRNFLRYVVHENQPFDVDTIVYPCAELTVVYNTKDRTQRTYQGHRNQITCLAMHPGGRIVATGDAISRIHIWDPLTLEFLGEINGIVKTGIQLLQFAPSGTSIVTVGSDVDRTIAIYDTATGEVISSTKGFVSPNNIFDIAYSNSGNELCAVGRKGSIMFYKNIKSKQRALRGVSGLIGRIGKKQTFFSVAYCGEEAFVGCASGEIYKFVNMRCAQVIQAHNSCEPVLCIYFNTLESTLVSGGNDGTVRTWTSNLKEVGIELDLAEDLDGDGVADNKSLNNSVVSVHCVGNKIIVGTKGSDIFEAIMPSTPTDPIVLTQLGWSHATGELWGLATHPSRDEFATSGDDNTLRIWSLRTNEMLNLRVLPVASRTVTYNPTGSLVAVGMQDGSVAILDSSKLRVKSSWKHSSHPILDIKFSYDESFLGTASADGNIYLYKSKDRLQYFRQAVCQGHTRPVSHIDFSLNGRYLQSCGEDCALYYWDMNGNTIHASDQMRDVDWATWTCTLGWPVQGIYSPNASINHVNACHAIPDIGVLATGDDEGLVKLFRYPSLDPGAIRQAHYGHAGHVTCVRFTYNRRHLISISGSDRTIIVWKHELELLESSDDEVDDDEVPRPPKLDYRYEIADVGERSVMEEAVHRHQSTQELIELYAELHPNQTQTPMPWRACVVEPDDVSSIFSNPNQTVDGATDVDLTLNWVHGYRCHDCRNNVRYNASGEIVYHTATLGIVYSKTTGKQRFLLGAHSDDILGMATHPTGQIFATGEAGHQPAIVVWDGESVRTLTRLTLESTRGISLLAFNSSGYYLASIGLDKESTLTVHEWKKGSLVMKAPTSKGRVLCLCFLATNETTDITTKEIIVTGGESHLKFWTWNGQNVSSQNAIWDVGRRYLHPTKRICPDVLCVSSASPMVCIAGTADGKLLVFRNYTCLEVHPNDPANSSSPVQSMWCRKSHYSNESQLYFTGDQAGNIAIWEYNENVPEQRIPVAGTDDGAYLRLLARVCGYSTFEAPFVIFEKREEAKSVDGQMARNLSIRSICERDGILLIGTHTTDILEIPYIVTIPPDAADQPPGALRKKPIVKFLCNSAAFALCGPGNGEVWGVATHEDFPFYFTSTEDCTIRCWNLSKNKLIGRIDLLATSCRALSLTKLPKSSNLFHLAAGGNDGKIRIIEVEVALNSFSMKMIVKNLESKVPRLAEEDKCQRIIQTIAYSKNGRYLAAGGHDGRIYIYEFADEMGSSVLKFSAMSGHSGTVAHLDFGSQGDKTFLQSACGNHELRFWSLSDEPDKIREVSAVDVKGVNWFTYSCPMGWPVQGIWPTSTDGAHIAAVTRSFSYKDVPVVATADSYGRVRLFNYPALQPGAPDKCYQGHSKNIRNISFTSNDDFCISVGGEDRSIFVWATDIQEELAERQVLNLQKETLAEEMKNQRQAQQQQQFPSLKQKMKMLDPLYEDSNVTSPFIESESMGGGGGSEDEEELTLQKKKKNKKQTTNLHLWKSVIREPSTWIAQSTEATRDSLPSASLELSYVYGYRGWDCRNNIGFADSSDEIVYHVAGVGVVLTVTDNTQIHNTDHSDDILCLAVHPDGHTVATGEIGRSPKIILWDANTGVTLRTILFHHGGVSHLRYTADGNYLISVGMDLDGTVAIHDCRTGSITGSGKLGRGIALNVLAVGEGKNFLTAGKKLVKFWDVPVNPGGRVEFASKGGLFGKDSLSKCATAATYLGPDAITGMSDGTLLLWKGRYNTKIERAHIGPVTSMTSISSSTSSGASSGTSDTGPRILTAGRDGHVYMWNNQLIRMWDLDLHQTSPPAYSLQIQAIAFREGKLALGTQAAEIYFVNLLSNETKKVMSGHFTLADTTAELRALATHPTKQYFMTGGDDMTIRLWNSKTRKQQAVALVRNKCRSCVYSPDGFQVAVGLIDGKLLILTDDLEMELVETTVCKDSLTVMSYAPNGSLLAVGSEDGNIYVLETKNYNIQAVLRGHQLSGGGRGRAGGGAITCLDWSKCNTILQSCCHSSELLYWNVETMEEISVPSLVRDCHWVTWTCIYGWSVQGIWLDHYKANVINCLDRTPDQRYIAIGDDDNSIKLYRSPCLSTASRYKEYHGHSSHVANLKFNHNGQSLLSVGGYDKCVMQFNVNYSKKS